MSTKAILAAITSDPNIASAFRRAMPAYKPRFVVKRDRGPIGGTIFLVMDSHELLGDEACWGRFYAYRPWDDVREYRDKAEARAAELNHEWETYGEVTP